MPKFTFECAPCAVRFHRILKMGEHPSHPCPSCQTPAPRFWPGQSFGFDFSASPTASMANTGVSKDDYPTADRVVGKSAEERWAVMHERQKVKKKVREVGGHRALIRKDGPGYSEYTAGNDDLVTVHKEFTKHAAEVYRQQREDTKKTTSEKSDPPL